MVLKMSLIAIVLLATFTVADLVRISVREKFEKQPPMAARNDEDDINKSVVEGNVSRADKDGASSPADCAEADSKGAVLTTVESPAALVQGGVSQDAVFSNYLLIAHYLKVANVGSRIPILTAACDWHAFSCEEIIKFANHSGVLRPFVLDPIQWANETKVFAEGRNNAGCINDPANAKSIVDSFKSKWPGTPSDGLKQAFIDNKGLRAARGVGPPPTRLQTGLRTDADMEKLVGDIKEMQLVKGYEQFAGAGTWGLNLQEFMQWARQMTQIRTHSEEEFKGWLRRIRAHGDQFSGPQLVTLIEAIPLSARLAPAVLTLLQYLEQYVTGVTCEEAVQIMRRFVQTRFVYACLDLLKANIVDGQNIIGILRFLEDRRPYLVKQVGELLRSRGPQPKNNAVFGVVRGNPVIFVVEESTSMDAKFTLEDDTFTCRNFCHNQLERVLEGLPNGTNFNVIQYSGSAMQIFPKPVLVNRRNIDAALQAVSGTWRGSYYIPGQDPFEMLRSIKYFAFKFKPFNRSAEKDSMKALQLAYATADSPAQQTDEGQDTLHDQVAPVVSKHLPQIYFLTSGQLEGRARQILDNIDEFDKGRNIPVNSIAFAMPDDPDAKQFAKDLASKTGGFFRSIELASWVPPVPAKPTVELSTPSLHADATKVAPKPVDKAVVVAKPAPQAVMAVAVNQNHAQVEAKLAMNLTIHDHSVSAQKSGDETLYRSPKATPETPKSAARSLPVSMAMLLIAALIT